LLIDYTLDGKVNKVDVAIQRIKTFEPLVNGFFDTPYYVAYSGGKDSDAIRILCELAGIKYDLVHNHTTVDAPETVYYVRSIPGIQISYPVTSMWKLIVKNKMPPTRFTRYCCSELKERGGKDRFVMTGVRWAESNGRKNRGIAEIQHREMSKRLTLNSDNDESRRLFENCQIQGKRILNPIVDWSEAEVWELLNAYGCASNPLYGEGFRRVGCVGCPLAGVRNIKYDFERWPKYKVLYIRAFQRMLEAYPDKIRATDWTDGQAVFNWWLREKGHRQMDGQVPLEGWMVQLNSQ